MIHQKQGLGVHQRFRPFPSCSFLQNCLFPFSVTLGAHNLSCYQCIRYANEQCGNESLRACPPVSDRCVTHISKDGEYLPAFDPRRPIFSNTLPIFSEDKGYVIKRECGLGPCGFEDDMVNKGLGLDGCDRSKDDYFCVSCCKTSGCNKNAAVTSMPDVRLASVTSVTAAVFIKINLP